MVVFMLLATLTWNAAQAGSPPRRQATIIQLDEPRDADRLERWIEKWSRYDVAAYAPPPSGLAEALSTGLELCLPSITEEQRSGFVALAESAPGPIVVVDPGEGPREHRSWLWDPENELLLRLIEYRRPIAAVAPRTGRGLVFAVEDPDASQARSDEVWRSLVDDKVRTSEFDLMRISSSGAWSQLNRDPYRCLVGLAPEEASPVLHEIERASADEVYVAIATDRRTPVVWRWNPESELLVRVADMRPYRP